MRLTPVLGATIAALSFSATGYAGSCGSNDAAHASHAAYEAHADIVDTAVAAGSFNTLAAALGAADLVDALKADGPYTVFAPTDEAFAKLPAGTVEMLLKPENKGRLIEILTYHVVPGRVMAEQVVQLDTATTLNGQRIDIDTTSGVRVENARVLKTDILASNGVIHVIDTVIIPTDQTIPQVAQSAKSFQTLLAAVSAADLAEVLGGEGPYTVFAPTDEAFAKLPEGTVAMLLKPENKDQLVAILTYHVVPGRVYADQVVTLDRARTVQGQNVRIRSDEHGVRINEATVVQTDIEASNGVIHVIDAVIIPS